MKLAAENTRSGSKGSSCLTAHARPPMLASFCLKECQYRSTSCAKWHTSGRLMEVSLGKCRRPYITNLPRPPTAQTPDHSRIIARHEGRYSSVFKLPSQSISRESLDHGKIATAEDGPASVSCCRVIKYKSSETESQTH